MEAYLDNLATTPIDPVALDAMQAFLASNPGNPHARHHPAGARAFDAVEIARGRIAAAVGARPEEVTFTPSATAANNLAILGLAESRRRKGRHVLVSAVEHPSVLEPAAELIRRGFEVVHVPVGPGGVLDPEHLASRLRPDTILVSVMAVNNEVGTIQPLEAVAGLLPRNGPVFHSDASQAPGKIPLDVLARVDAFTLSSHKVHGPQGAAVLVVRKQRSILPRPVLFGGGQERGLWPGTLNGAAIVGFGEALQRTVQDRDIDTERLARMTAAVMAGLERSFPGCRRNGDPARTVPHCLSVTFSGLAGETMVAALAREGVSAALGSACSGEAAAASHVLVAMGLSSDEVRRTLRFSPGRLTTQAEIDYTVDVLGRLGGRFRT